MNARDKFKKIIRTLGGFVVGAAGVLTWLNVTPSMVGQAAYDVIYIALPIVTFAGGALSGWGLTKLWSEKVISAKDKECSNRLADKDAEIHKAIEDHTASFLNLQAKQLSAIGYCIKNGGTTSIPSESELARELQSLKRMGYADSVDGSPYSSYWFVTDKAMNPLQNSDECWNLLSDAMKAGRFDVWGRYVETPPEVQEALFRDADER